MLYCFFSPLFAGRSDLFKTKHPFAYILEFKVFSVKDHDHNFEDTAIRARKQIDDGYKKP